LPLPLYCILIRTLPISFQYLYRTNLPPSLLAWLRFSSLFNWFFSNFTKRRNMRQLAKIPIYYLNASTPRSLIDIMLYMRPLQAPVNRIIPLEHRMAIISHVERSYLAYCQLTNTDYMTKNMLEYFFFFFFCQYLLFLKISFALLPIALNPYLPFHNHISLSNHLPMSRMGWRVLSLSVFICSLWIVSKMLLFVISSVNLSNSGAGLSNFTVFQI